MNGHEKSLALGRAHSAAAYSSALTIPPEEHALVPTMAAAARLLADADPRLFLPQYVPHHVVPSVTVSSVVGQFFALSLGIEKRRFCRPPVWWWRCVATLRVGSTTNLITDVPTIAEEGVTALVIDADVSPHSSVPDHIPRFRNITEVTIMQPTGHFSILCALVKLPLLSCVRFLATGPPPAVMFGPLERLPGLRSLEIHASAPGVMQVLSHIRAPLEELTLRVVPHESALARFEESLRVLRILGHGDVLSLTKAFPRLHVILPRGERHDEPGSVRDV